MGLPAAGTVQGVSLQEIASSLGPVTGITQAGDGRLFLTIRTGLITILENGSPRPQPFLDIPPGQLVRTCNPNGQGGGATNP